MVGSARRDGRQSARSAREHGRARKAGSGISRPPWKDGESNWCSEAAGSCGSPSDAGSMPMMADTALMAVARSRCATNNESENVKIRRW